MSTPAFVPVLLCALAAALAGAGAPAGPFGQAPPQPPRQQQPTEIEVVIGGEPGAAPRYAVPDFIALTSDAATVAAAKTIGEVLFDDLAFEREFDMIPRNAYRQIPAARSLEEVPLDRWRELGADALVLGTVRRTGSTLQVQVRLLSVRGGQMAMGREYRGSADNPRQYAHTIADEIHLQQRGLRGVARTRLTFSSDRDGEQVRIGARDRPTQEVYIADYDGANQRRVTKDGELSITPVWAPDGRTIAYTGYRRNFPDLVLAFLHDGRRERPAGGTAIVHNWLPAWSPDGRRLAFTSNRDGNAEIYVMDVDGSDVRRLTNHPAIDTSPTWSPTGHQIAFVSERSGTPQIYTVGADGTDLRRVTSEYCDRPTWSPAPFNEIAFTCRVAGNFDLKVYDVASGEIRQLTFGEGLNESPAFAPNGRHLAFTSDRSGLPQIYTMGRDGRGLRQITREGRNKFPNWSQ
jgi:TolB protein